MAPDVNGGLKVAALEKIITSSYYQRTMKVQRIGILGGGQLARMLALAAHPLGLKPAILATQPGDPAAQVCMDTQLGSLSDRQALRKFLHDLSCLTFESEFVDTALLERCLPQTTHVFPKLANVATIQDRLTQKQLLEQWNIPCAPWCAVSTNAELKQACHQFPQGMVLKQRRFGYDGYGTFVFRDSQKVDPLLLKKSTHGFIAEGLIDFKRELAISFVRSTTGEFLSLPLVESVQVNARCVSVAGPVTHPRLKTLSKAFKALMEGSDYYGILAVELFAVESKSGRSQLLVNELAPRVHNSAHYSQNALTVNQFEYHLRAGLGLPLPKVQCLRPGFAMVNLLGEGHSKVELSAQGVGHLHWYGKSENRAGRKLGHINVLDKTAKSALARALKWRKEFKL